VKPLKPAIPLSKNQSRGIGAWELAGRVSQLKLGDEVFENGFANPDNWTSQATTTEIGLNWYLNDYLKVSMFWLHGEFGTPVQFQPGRIENSTDMAWLRCQLYF
jgi:phosphate-selective porin OprO/OprP